MIFCKDSIQILNLLGEKDNATVWKKYYDKIEMSGDFSCKKIYQIFRRIQGIFEVVQRIFELRKSEIKDYLPGDFQDYFVGERLKKEIRREINFHPFLYCLEGKIINIESLKIRKIAMEELYMTSKIMSKQQRDNKVIQINLDHLEKIKDCKMQTFQVIMDYLHSPLNI